MIGNVALPWTAVEPPLDGTFEMHIHEANYLNDVSYPVCAESGFRVAQLSSPTYHWVLRREHLWLADLGLTRFRRVPIRPGSVCPMVWDSTRSKLGFSAGDILELDLSTGTLATAVDAEAAVAAIPGCPGPQHGFSLMLAYRSESEEWISRIDAGKDSYAMWVRGNQVGSAVLLPSGPWFDYCSPRDAVVCGGAGTLLDRNSNVVGSIPQEIVQAQPTQISFSVDRAAVSTPSGLAVWHVDTDHVEWVDVSSHCVGSWIPGPTARLMYVRGGVDLMLADLQPGDAASTRRIAGISAPIASPRLVPRKPVHSRDGRYSLAELFETIELQTRGGPRRGAAERQIVVDHGTNTLMGTDLVAGEIQWIGDAEMAL